MSFYTLLMLTAFVVIPIVQGSPIKEKENRETVNDGANAFDQHYLRQLHPKWREWDPDCERKCSSKEDCCVYMGVHDRCMWHGECLQAIHKG